MALRRQVKNCAADGTRRELKTLISKMDETITHVKTKRESLGMNELSSFLMFPADSPLASMREQMNKRKTTEQEMKVNSETKKASGEATLQQKDLEKTSKKAKKRAREETKSKKQLEEACAKMPKTTDEVDAMNFSDSDEDSDSLYPPPNQQC